MPEDPGVPWSWSVWEHMETLPLHKSTSPHPNQMVISDILGILKTLEHKAPLPCLFLARGPFDSGNANYEREQIPPSLDILSTTFFTIWNINVLLIFLYFLLSICQTKKSQELVGSSFTGSHAGDTVQGETSVQKSMHWFNQMNFKTDFTVAYWFQAVRFDLLRYLNIFHVKCIFNGRFFLSILPAIQKK